MAIPKTTEICREHLFTDRSELMRLNVPEIIIDRLTRMRDIYNQWLNEPSIKAKDFVDILKANYGVSESTAYEDVKIIKNLIGDINAASKSFHRWRFNEKIWMFIDMAEKKEDIDGGTRALGNYAKYNKLDQEDIQEIDWSAQQVQPFDPTSDPSEYGVKRITNLQEQIKKMEKKYGGGDFEDVTYEEVDFNEGLDFDINIEEEDE